MAQTIVFNGVSYDIPDTGDEDWGEDLTSFFVAISQGALQKTGGTFTLTADANFGASFGLVSAYLKSITANISTAGLIRLARTDSIGFRNFANDGNLLITVDASNNLTFNGTKVILSGLIVNADIDAAAAIERTKLASGTNYRILANSSAGVMSENAALTSGHVVIADANGQLAGEAALAISRGGTGQATKAPAFDALSPMNASGDIIYGGASGTGTALPKGSDTQVLTLVSGLPAWANPGASTAPLLTKYTSGSGTHTITGSPLYMRITMVGGGGGGSGSGTSASAGDGGNGGSTTFGVGLLAGGGGTGGYAEPTNAGAGGPGGTASTGAATGLAIEGGRGCGLIFNNSSMSLAGGAGAASFFGGQGGSANSLAGTAAAVNSGSGGGGGGISGTSVATGSGGGAGGYVTAVIASPSATYAYAVGAAGAAGTLGTSGAAGGAGGSGIIIVEEFYQ